MENMSQTQANELTSGQSQRILQSTSSSLTTDTHLASPEYPRTMSSVGRQRSDSDSAIITAVTDGTVESTLSFNYPVPPLNSPYTRSEIGAEHEVSANNLASKLEHMPANLATPPSSERDDQGKPTLSHQSSDIIIRDFGSGIAPPKTLRRNTRLTSRAERGSELTTPTPNKTDEYYATGPSFPEHSVWGAYAEEDVEKGLKRLAMLARDLHKVDGSKTIEQHYSERLSKLIEEGEIQFDGNMAH